MVTQTVRNLPAVETWVQSMGWEDSLEKGIAIHSSFLPKELHGQRRATVHGVTKNQAQMNN